LATGLAEVVQNALDHPSPDPPIAIVRERVTGKGWSASAARSDDRMIAGQRIRTLVIALETAMSRPTRAYVLCVTTTVGTGATADSTKALPE